MSDVAAVALITGVITGVVGLAGLAFSFWSASSERKQRRDERREDHGEWYKRTLFEKRLDAVQDGYRWVMKFNVAITRSDASQPSSPENEELRSVCKEAREWYDRSTIFLHDGLPGSSEFIGLINSAAAHANGQQVVDVWSQFIAAGKELQARADRLLSVEHSVGGGTSR